MEIHEIFSVSATQDDCLMIDIDYTGHKGGRMRAVYAYRASDIYAPITPLITQWIADNKPVILPYEPPPPPTPEQIRIDMTQLSMVDFRRKLRGIKVIQRLDENGNPVAELDGIYEADILEKIDLIADKELAAEARDYFLYAQYIERVNPWVEILGSMFDITPEEIDTFWMA